MDDTQISRRSVLRGAAGLAGVTALGSLTTGCTANSDPFIDVSNLDLPQGRRIVRLQISGETGSPLLLPFGTSSQEDSAPLEVTLESSQHRVVLGSQRIIADSAFSYATSVQINRVAGVWVRPIRSYEAFEPADEVVVRSAHGQIILSVWIEPLEGRWSERPIDVNIVAVHAAMMRRGHFSEVIAFSPPRVLDHSGEGMRDEVGHEMWDLGSLDDVEIKAIDPLSYRTTPAPQIGAAINLFCVGQAHLPDGQLLTAGGHISGQSIGIDAGKANRLHRYDSNTRRWVRPAAEMRAHRWYPTVTALSDGRMLIASGSSQAFVGDVYDFWPIVGFYAHLENNYEIYDPVTDALVDLGSDGTPELVDLSEEETYAESPVRVLHARPLATYPAIFVVPGGERAPEGNLLLQEANRGWLYRYDSASSPPLQRAGRKYEMPAKGSRSYPHYGSAVLLGFSEEDTMLQLLVVGGSRESLDNHTLVEDEGDATETTVIFDYDLTRPLDAQAGWRHSMSMSSPRILCDATLLPNGDVLVSGGVSKGFANHSYLEWSVREAEIFHPPSESFRRVASATLDRRYHSTALLTLEGHVLKMGSTGGFAAGTGRNGEAWISSHTEIEKYTPSYFWRSPQPKVTISGRSSGTVDMVYGSEYTAVVVGTDPGVCEIVLMRAGAVTHGLNMDQRLVRLSVVSVSEDQVGPPFSPTGTDQKTIVFRAPRDASIAPPGPYMLIVVDQHGVPSEGVWQLVGVM